MTTAQTLARFHVAQEDCWARALAELGAGRKVSHWMWFVFPQLATLGRSERSRYFGIADLAEARAYLADPVLGPRLCAAAQAVLGHPERSAEAIFGPLDARKLRSCATLFEAAGGGPEFAALLTRFFAQKRCAQTLAEIGAG